MVLSEKDRLERSLPIRLLDHRSNPPWISTASRTIIVSSSTEAEGSDRGELAALEAIRYELLGLLLVNSNDYKESSAQANSKGEGKGEGETKPHDEGQGESNGKTKPYDKGQGEILVGKSNMLSQKAIEGALGTTIHRPSAALQSPYVQVTMEELNKLN
ncbi:hypothetical protein PIB30_011152 [Stylosanthes scabra]|uniref:Uncharacterized protein n=1 Tax=Stylosanthes scabra TaxID=79078 RepID=A0ABU6Q5M0_9FABA|nr:hypothetical protein [Stylosanthes scabra]